MEAFYRIFRILGLAALVTMGVSSEARATRLSFLADANFPTGTYGPAFGGISGLTFDPVMGELLALSDDRSEVAPARFYSVKVALRPGSLEFKPVAQTFLRSFDGRYFRKGEIDPEAIVLFRGSRFFISSEGSGKTTPPTPPAVSEFDGGGRLIHSLPLPDKFRSQTSNEPSQGVRENCAFEGLALTPSENSLFTTTECPLLQDGPSANFTTLGFSRILQFYLGRKSIPTAEFVYVTERNPKPPGALEDYGNGISEMLALNERELLVLERGTAKTVRGVETHLRLFKVNLSKGATNVSGLESLQGKRFYPLKKELVLDFESILPKLNPRWSSIDNLEAMSFGPTLPNGNRTLLFASDNNFSPTQRTQVIAFELQESSKANGK
jgi:hypothetical protein